MRRLEITRLEMTRRIKRLKNISIIALLVLLLLPSAVMAETTTEPSETTATATDTAAVTAAKPKLNTKKMYFYVGGKFTLRLENASGTVKWSSSNKKVATVSKSGKVKAKATGKATIKAKYKNKVYKCKVIVLSNDKFVSTWCKSLGKQIKKGYKNPYDRVLAATCYVMENFQYGNSGSNFEVLTKGRGTCYSGNKLLVQILKSMGYKAKLRFAAKDNMSRYPSNVFFMKQHYNVLVKIKGKKYYVDGTPGTGFFYMSTSKKPIYMAMNLFGEYQVSIDKVPGHN